MACGAGEPGLAFAADFELPRPVIRLTAASTQIATSATAIAAVQLARCGSARTASGSNAGVWTDAGASSACSRSNSATSGSASMPITRLMLRMCPRA